MFASLAALLVAAAGTPVASDPLPSVAVLPIAAKQGIHQDMADQLTDSVVTRVRQAGRFARVVSSADVQAVLGLEQQKQLLDCDQNSCLAEIVGTLGVDFVLYGTVGRFGKAWLLNLKLVNARTAANEASVSRAAEGSDESVLLGAVNAAVAELLGIPAPAPVPPVPVPAATPRPPPGSPMPMVLRVGGGVGLAAAALVALPAIAAAVVATGIVGLSVYAAQTYVKGLGFYRIHMTVAVYAGAVAAALLGGLALLVAAAGGAAVGSSFIVD